ncbi:two-component system, OmpR family, phosphate regulon sensor histidine kinase PhoR [Desulfacinum hydrothermale DSM 13146]|uniref:histidine kinase n=1 Tax=Desulfacinum hydrothermale DSM 13146 TaxID=1121390 RepID=A0A1W1XRI7_9BACT|nr:ATP-binding protein [Desulfacinum hydrothermale]SMC26589.1 two-component system, OmpR family, phosphate regulon sensor histidine kinase PhoR [Desulfacinum hydrothermale DSM 13146]
MSFRMRLLAAFWAVLVLALALPGFFFQKELRQAAFGDSKERIQKELAFVHWSLQEHASFPWLSDLDTWCTQAADRLGVRITYIAQGGKVVADSHVPYDKLGFLDNHWSRPEVVAARAHGFGISVRRSATLRRDLLYAAVPVDHIANLPPGVLRLAMPVSSLRERLDEQYKVLWAILGLGLIAAAALAYFLSSFLERPIAQLADLAEGIGRGQVHGLRRSLGDPSLDALARTLEHLGRRIEQQMKHLEDQKTRLETILESMHDGVILLADDGTIETCNRAIHDIQKDPRPRAGLKPLEVFLNRELQQACDHVLKGGAHQRVQISMEGDRTYDVHVVPLQRTEKSRGVLLVFHDISELKRVARIRRDFVANVSHELRTPLTAIKGYAETLLESPCAEQEEPRSFVETILRKANHMTRMVNDLLTLTRLESRPLPVPDTAVDARTAVRAAVETCQQEALKKEMDLVVDLPNTPLWVSADRDHLVQVFQNLMENAIRYSIEKTPICTSAREEGDRVVFYVEDQGPGIRPEHQQRIFERFYRVDKQRETATGSTGLGLAICRHIVQKLGGKIWVESPVPGTDRGARFGFFVKKAPGSPATAVSDHNTPHGLKEHPA